MKNGFCMIIGAGLFALFLSLIPLSYHSQAVKSKEGCENNLPRNQECAIVAIPKEKEKNMSCTDNFWVWQSLLSHLPTLIVVLLALAVLILSWRIK
jgi:hypothetical protein